MTIHTGQHGRDCKLCTAFNASQVEALRTFAKLEANTEESNRAVGLKDLRVGQPSCSHPELGCAGSCREQREFREHRRPVLPSELRSCDAYRVPGGGRNTPCGFTSARLRASDGESDPQPSGYVHQPSERR